MITRMLNILILLTIAVTACSSPDAVSPTPGIESTQPTSPTFFEHVQPGQSFPLRKGEAVQLEEDQLIIRFVEVTEDSRCPSGMECFWEGNAKLLIAVGEQEFLLTIGKLLEGDKNTADLGGGSTLRVLRLDPYPGEGSQEYQATLIVEHTSSQPYNYPEYI